MHILITQPQVGAVSETFLRNHAQGLAGQVSIAHGPMAEFAGRSALLRSFPAMIRGGLRFLGGVRPQGNLQNWAATLSYIELIKKLRPRVVLAEFGTHACLVREACQRCRVPLVVHFHGADASHIPTLERLANEYQEMFSAAAAIVGVSPAMLANLEALGAPRNKLHYIPYGVDTARFQNAAPELAEPVALAVGRMVEKKSPHLTLLAFREVLLRHPEARLRFIGDGPLLGVCQDLARELNMESSIHFAGAQSHALVCQEMRSARLFVQHSVTAIDGDSEGMPNAILEASSSGLPVVATRHAGIPESVIDGKTGFLVAERDVAGMARRMLELFADPPLAQKMGRAGAEHMRDQFELNSQIEKLDAVLQAATEHA